MLKNIFIPLLLLISTSLQAQIAFPLTFTWKGMINNQVEFEMIVKMVDSYAALNGKKSRLSGYCTFTETWKRLRVEGMNDQGKITLNLFEADQLVQSFLFETTDKRQQKQHGEWTDGKLKYSVWLEPFDPKTLSKPQLIGFCHGVNDRISRLQADSIAMPILKKLPKEPFLKVGEGYRLTDEAFLEADYYGATFLEFADTTSIGDSLVTIHQLNWQLLPTQLARPFFLETRRLMQNSELVKLELSIWQYVKDSWESVNQEVFPETFIKDKSLQLPEHILEFMIASNQLIFFIEGSDQPLILIWDGQTGKLTTKGSR